MAISLTGCKGNTVAIARGHNRWVLGRTDRDAPTHSDVLQTAGAFLHRVLTRASPEGQRGVFDVLPVPGSLETRYVIGAARPVTIEALQPKNQSEALDFTARPGGGKVLARFSDCAKPMALKADRPWIVLAEFDWRAPSKRIKWPARKVDAFGLPEDDATSLDWMLMAATHSGPAKQSDTEWSTEVSKGAKRELAKALKPLRFGASAVLGLVAVGVGGVVAWEIAQRAKKRRRA